jgi:iron(III) transport system substrate-binding protein
MSNIERRFGRFGPGIVAAGRVAAGIVASTLASLALFVGPAAAQATWDDVIAAAKKEGRVVFYNGQTGWPEPIAAAKSFEAKYGIKVEMLEVRSVELMERIRTEVTNNKVGGDITLMGSTGTAPLAQAGLLQPHGAIPNQAKAVLKPWVPEEIPVFVINYGVAINTRLVPPGQEPKSWKDLADPKWKGKILSDEMIFPGGGQSWFAVMLKTFGREFHETLVKNDLQYDRNIPGKAQRVARGEFAISIPFNVQELARLKGLPVKGIIPEEGTPYTPVGIAMIKDAKNPNAALLFMNHMLSEEVQLSFAKVGYPVAIRGLEDKVPDEWKFSVYGKLLGHADVDKQPERLKLASEIYNRK